VANFFLGFPVARAKIADMIEGYAESLSTYDHYYYLTLLDTLDAITQTKSGSGAITLFPEYLKLNTGLTQWSLARILKVPYYTVPATSWTKKRKFHTKIKLETTTGGKPLVRIYCGNSDSPMGFGFVVDDHGIYGRTGNGSSADVLLLETIPAGPYSIIRDLEAVFWPGTKVEYFIDGVKKGQITTKLPSGTSSSEYVYWIQIQNQAAKDDTLLISHWKFYQEP